MNIEKINIVCTIDNNYAQHCGVMLYSLFDQNSKAKFHIFILTEGISKKNQDKLKQVCDHFDQVLEIIKIELKDPKKYPVSAHISVATYYRLTIPTYIPENIDKVLFLDADMVINGEISELWKMNIDQYSHASAGDLGHDSYINEHLNMPKEAVCFNAGVMLMNLKKWRKEDIASRVIDYIVNNQTKIKYWDQDALNAVLYDDYLLISNKWNLLYNFFLFDAERLTLSQSELNKLVKNPCIIHYNTASKPWHKEDKHPYKHRYVYYLSQTPWKDYNFNWDKVKRMVYNFNKKVKIKLLKIISN